MQRIGIRRFSTGMIEEGMWEGGSGVLLDCGREGAKDDSTGYGGGCVLLGCILAHGVDSHASSWGVDGGVREFCPYG